MKNSSGASPPVPLLKSCPLSAPGEAKKFKYVVSPVLRFAIVEVLRVVTTATLKKHCDVTRFCICRYSATPCALILSTMRLSIETLSVAIRAMLVALPP